MCTVTYLPVDKKHFLLTQNRDEKFSRGIALPPGKVSIGVTSVIYPTDTDARGTWIALSEAFSCCLLNGGKEKHVSKPPYKQSRGNIILDFYKFNTVDDFLRAYNFDSIEPFTLVVVEHESRTVHEIILSNTEVQYQVKNGDLPHLWSSSTLYDEATRNLRKYYFNLFTQTKAFTQDNILRFHQDGFKQDAEEGFIIHRDVGVKTVSVSSILKQEKSTFMYIDLLNKKKQLLEL